MKADTVQRGTALVRLCVALISLAPSAMAATAASTGATVYRCGQTYQQVPCTDGKPVAVDDARDPAQRQAAQQAAAAERRIADGLAAERTKRGQGLQPTRRPSAAKPAAEAATPAVSSRQKHPRSKAGRHTQPLEASDKTLYAARQNEKSTSQAKLPPPP